MHYISRMEKRSELGVYMLKEVDIIYIREITGVLRYYLKLIAA